MHIYIYILFCLHINIYSFQVQDGDCLHEGLYKPVCEYRCEHFWKQLANTFTDTFAERQRARNPAAGPPRFRNVFAKEVVERFVTPK